MNQLKNYNPGNHDPVKIITTLVTMIQLKNHNPGYHEPVKESQPWLPWTN